MIKSGIINLDKGAGITSHTAVSKVRRLFCGVKAGHCGTLDPMATGVLPVLLGAATPFAQFVEGGEKVYRAGIRFGINTDTLDTTGTVLRERPVPDFDEAALLAALAGFVGDIKQVPPMYSALKVGGRKLCNIAREGGEVARAPRAVRIEEISLLDYDTGRGAHIRVRCGKGVYIRTLIEDIGELFGCGAAMDFLRREAVGRFCADTAVTLQELEAAEDPAAFAIPLENLFSHLRTVDTDEFYKRLLLSGQAVLQKKLGVTVPEGETVKLAGDEFYGLLAAKKSETGLMLRFIRRHVV